MTLLLNSTRLWCGRGAAAGPGSTVLIDTANAMMWEDWRGYANTAAFYADARELSDPDPSFATGGANCRYNQISWGRNFELRTGSIYKGHSVLRANQPAGGQTPQLTGDTRVAGVATSKADIIMYWAMRYSNAWTDVNLSYGGAMAYKIFALGLTSPTGRLGMAWTNTDQLVSENYWGGYGDNRDSIGPTEIAFNSPQIFGRPSSLWTNSPIVHTLVDVQTSPSTAIAINYYIWADGDPKPSVPTHTHMDYSGGGVAPLINTFKLGNNMNAPIANTQYIEWLEWGMWDRTVNSTPVRTAE